MFNLRKLMLGLTTAFAASLVFATTAHAQSTTQELSRESVIETIKRDGVLRVGISMFAPWTMRDVNGDLIGFEIDVARKLAEDMGVEVEFTPTAWDGIIPALVAGNFDVIISGMSVTTPRNLTVNFTRPYAYSGLKIFANQEMTAGFTFDDFNRPEVTFATVRGSIAETGIQAAFPNATIVELDDSSLPTQEVLNGNAHAAMASEPLPSRDVRQYPNVLYIPLDMEFQQQAEGIALRKGDPDALNVFNNWIELNSLNGWLEERHVYWFETEDWANQVPKN